MSGGCTGIGLEPRRWEICWGRSFRSAARTISIGVWTRCWSIRANSFRICGNGGPISLRAKFDVLLYDLTSTYFESDPPWDPEDKRRFGHSRDKRSDCVQVVLALVLTPEGYPIGYEVLPGNTADITTLKRLRKKIEEQYGPVERIWLMDRGIPTEESLAAMRASQPPVRYLVGTPKGRLTRLEKKLAALPWTQARPQVQVKLLPEEGELYVLVNSQARIDKERAMRLRRLKRLWARLKELQAMKPLSRDELLKKLAVAQSQAGRVAGLVEVRETGPRPGGQRADLRFQAAQRQAARAAPPRGTVFAALQSAGAGPGQAVGDVFAAGGD